jgi:DNA-binding transcriptional ArsR family regulator
MLDFCINIFIVLSDNVFNIFLTWGVRSSQSACQNKTRRAIKDMSSKNKTHLKQGGEGVQLNYADLRKSILVLRAVNHKLRQRIVELIDAHEMISVTEIYQKLRLEQSVTSQHLAILRRAGVVITDRQGKFIYYSLDKDRLSQISRIVEELAL